jgi:hypothetical protein
VEIPHSLARRGACHPGLLAPAPAPTHTSVSSQPRLCPGPGPAPYSRPVSRPPLPPFIVIVIFSWEQNKHIHSHYASMRARTHRHTALKHHYNVLPCISFFLLPPVAAGHFDHHRNPRGHRLFQPGENTDTEILTVLAVLMASDSRNLGLMVSDSRTWA